MDNDKIFKLATGVEGTDEGECVMFTESALAMIGKVRTENNIGDDFKLRIAAKGGGCSGMSFILGFDNEIESGDRLLESDTIDLLTDAHTLFYLMGVTLDYVDSPEGSGFTFNSPGNMKTCGCKG